MLSIPWKNYHVKTLVFVICGYSVTSNENLELHLFISIILKINRKDPSLVRFKNYSIDKINNNSKIESGDVE